MSPRVGSRNRTAQEPRGIPGYGVSGLFGDPNDARAHGKKDIGRMKAEELPEPMRRMSEGDRTKFLDGKARERGELQKRISDLSQKRDQFIATERKKQAAGPKTFDDAVTSSVRTST